jgi:hypothetical protein
MIKRKHLKVDPANIEEVEKAIEAIYAAFVWSKTTQGHDYWSNVCRKLKKLKAQGEGSA